MSKFNKKRCRKSKLVPRIYDLDDNIEEDNDVRQKEKEIPRKKLRIHRENKNEDYNSENYITSKLQYGITTPIQNYPASPMQFSIKVEVEEFNELDTNEDCIIEDEVLPTVTEELCQQSVKTQVSTPSISDLDISKEADMLLLQTENIDLNANTSNACSDSLKMELHSNATDKMIDLTEKRGPYKGCYYILSQEDILSYQPDESDVASKMLSIESKNLLGRSLKSILETGRHETLIQTALKNKKLTLSHYRDILLMYKCYICSKAWWHLYPFREHIREHDDEDLLVSLEAYGQESNLIAYKGALPPLTDISDVDSDCWHCGKSYTIHKMSEKNEDGSFNCLYCMVKFFTCTQLITHEGVCCWRKYKMLEGKSQCLNCRYCPVIVFSENEMNDHLVLRHSVRSDIPMPTTFKICPYCKGKYFYFYFHVCPKRTETTSCVHCNRKFPYKILRDLHLKLTKNDEECSLCGDVLLKQCMMTKHLLDKHNKEFAAGTTCTQCAVFFVFLDDQAQREHRLVFHKRNKRNDRNKHNNLFEPLLIPYKILTNPRDPLLKLSKLMKNSTVMNSVILTKVTKISVLKPNVDAGGVASRKQSISQYGSAPKDNEPVPASSSSITISINNPEDTDATEKSITSVAPIEMETNQTDTSIDISHIEEKEESEQDDGEDIIRLSNIKQEPVDIDSKDRNPNYEQLLSKVFRVSENFRTLNKAVKIERQDEEDDDLLLDDNLEPDMRLSPNSRSRRIYKCKKCGFKDVHKEYRLHMMNNCKTIQEVVESNMQYVCTKCNRGFSSMKLYLQHFIFHGFKRLTCPECSETFQNITGLRAHINSHVKNSYLKLLLISRASKQTKVFKCKKCKGKVVFENFFAHWESHLELQPTVDDKEDGDEATSAALEPELLKELIGLLVSDRGRRTRSVKNCNVCHRHFDRVNDCKRHLIEHLLIDAYSYKPDNLVLKCQICSQGFSKADRYKQHMRDHSFLPIYKCELCNKTFSDSSNFTKHKKVHNLRAFICDLCGKKFQAKFSIEKHMQMHVVTGQINCKDCPKVFHSESAYKKHYKNFHDKTQLKFKCAMCNKRFNCIKDKWDHLWQVHKERNGKADCPICYKSFRKYSDVKLHVRSDHQMGVRVFNIQQFNSEEKREIAKALQESLMGSKGDNASSDCDETLIVID